MKPRELVIGEVVQLNPETVKNKAFAGCFLIVTEPKAFGCQGYVEALGSDQVCSFLERAYYRPTWDEMEVIGMAEWMRKDSDE
jgi:hypothetical protein